MRAGELIAVDYLYSQTGQVLHMTVPEPDEAVDEDQLVEDMHEGFVDVSVDVVYMYLSNVKLMDSTGPQLLKLNQRTLTQWFVALSSVSM